MPTRRLMLRLSVLPGPLFTGAFFFALVLAHAFSPDAVTASADVWQPLALVVILCLSVFSIGLWLHGRRRGYGHWTQPLIAVVSPVAFAALLAWFDLMTWQMGPIDGPLNFGIATCP